MSKKQKQKLRVVILVLAALALVGVAGWYLDHTNIPVLMPQGDVGIRERNLIWFALGLSLIVVVPVFILLAAIAWKYREGNTKADYRPDFTHSRRLETVWWLVPTVLITILSVVTWVSSHSLDPFRSLNEPTRPLVVQVVALDWKWLFIYPEQHVASINLLQLPIERPITFEITADAPMNSFWIPQLGGQMYAMPGMSTQLHLIANKVGDYKGSSANISGSGFAGMSFVARAGTQPQFEQWVANIRHSSAQLDAQSYAALARSSQNNPRATYTLADQDLYNQIMRKYMAPGYSVHGMEAH